jgi:hypothetical protein
MTDDATRERIAETVYRMGSRSSKITMALERILVLCEPGQRALIACANADAAASIRRHVLYEVAKARGIEIDAVVYDRARLRAKARPTRFIVDDLDEFDPEAFDTIANPFARPAPREHERPDLAIWRCHDPAAG